jgi:signal transduction histidine kinase
MTCALSKRGGGLVSWYKALMVIKTSSKFDLVRLTLSLSAAVFGVGVIMLWTGHLGSAAGALRFNSYALLSIAAILSNLVLLVLVSRPRHKTPETFWFILFLLEIVVWAFCEMMQRLSAGPDSGIGWYSLAAPAWIALGPTFFVYALTMVDRLKLARQLLGILALIAAPVFFILLALKSPWLVQYDPALAIAYPWGYYVPYGPAFTVFLLWLEMFFAAALVLVYREYRRAQDPALRQRARFVCGALLVPLVGGTITDGLLPVLGIGVLPLAVPLTSIMAAIIGYATLRYHIFRLNPNTIAANILAGMNEIVIILNDRHEIEYINDRAYTLLGFSPGSLVGDHLGWLFKDEIHLKRFKAGFLQRGIDSDFESADSEIRDAAGRALPVVVSAAQITSPEGQRAHILVLTDLSRVQSIERTVVERTQQLLEEQARLHASIDSVAMGFIITDNHHGLVSMNAAAYGLLDLKPSTEVNLAAIERRLSEVINLKTQLKNCLTKKHSIKLDEVVMGRKFFRLFLSPVMVEDRALGVVVLIQDITEEKVLARSKEEFFSIASHELRTPLTAIRGNAALIQQYYTKQLKDRDLADMVNDIHDSSVRLIQIVNDFLDASRLEQGRMEFKPEVFSLQDTLTRVQAELAGVLKEKKLYLKLANPPGMLPVIYGDKSRVEQIVYNLLGNALKFTPTGGIVIEATRIGRSLKVAITDTGPGIPIEKQMLLFHKFQQAGSSTLTRDVSRGTGLGLYISRLLAEQMGGQVSLAESSTAGTTFFFTVPLATKQQIAAAHDKVLL